MRCLFVLSCLCLVVPSAVAERESRRTLNTPITFEPNQGQANPEVLFAAPGRGFNLLLEKAAVVFDFGNKQVRLEWGRSALSVQPESPTPARRNYRKGAAPSSWFDAVPTFEKVRYSEALPGVDLVFYARPELEFDLVLAPGTDPHSIELKYSGFDSVIVEPSGDLALHMAQGVLRQHLPVVVQDGRPIQTRYVRHNNNTVGLVLAKYNTKHPLVIDPKISYATYLGGTGGETPSSVTVDANGNYYLAVMTSSTGYPGLPPSQAPAGDIDIAISKFTPDNALVYTTLLGGSLAETAYKLAAATDGSLYLSFATASTNFPRPVASPVNGTGPGTGVLKLNPSGVLTAVFTWNGAVNNPVLGQVNNAAYGLTLDAAGNVWLTGTTLGFANQASSVQPNVAGGRDVFVARLNPDLSRVTYFTYLGGGLPDEAGNAIAVDDSGGVYVSGNNGFGIDGVAFVLKLDSTANKLLYNTTLTAGGGGGGIVLDRSDLWVCANAVKGFIPTNDALQKTYGGGLTDAALFRLNATDGHVRYATYLGGSGADFVNDLVQEPSGDLIAFGNTSSANFPVTPDAQQKTALNPNTAGTAFFAEIDPAGALIYSSYLGGSGTFDFGLAAAIDRKGNPLLVGTTTSSNFPVTAQAFQARNAGGQDAYLARIELASPADPNLARNAVQNAASFLSGPIAPGEIITLYPTNAGPSQIATAALTSDRHIATLVAGTRVLFDGVPAPIVYTVSGQISVVVPYKIQNQPFTRIVVESNGVRSRAVVVPVTDVAPGVFTVAGGTGQAVVLNQDSSLNSIGTPADRNSIIVFFATGEGQTTPPGEDGRLNEFPNLSDFPRPQAPVTVTIGGVPAEILYAGGAPGFLAGLEQFNVRVPQAALPGPAIPLVITVKGIASPVSVTLSVR